MSREPDDQTIAAETGTDASLLRLVRLLARQVAQETMRHQQPLVAAPTDGTDLIEPGGAEI